MISETTIEEIIRFCVSTHRFFSIRIWPKNKNALHITDNINEVTPSYHNQHHILGVLRTIESVKPSSQLTDPFNIKGTLEKWNTTHEPISLDLFWQLTMIAFAAHDLGNLTQKNEIIISEGKPRLQFSDEFQLEVGPCEERSAVLIMQLIKHFDTKHEISDEHQMLIKHLIMQTLFKPQESHFDVLFWQFVQVVDQVGTHYFAHIPSHHTVAGLLNELWVGGQKAHRKLPPLKTFLDFLPIRMEKLVPDEEMRKEIVSLFDPDGSQKILMARFNVPEIEIDLKRDFEKLYRGEFLLSAIMHDK